MPHGLVVVLDAEVSLKRGPRMAGNRSSHGMLSDESVLATASNRGEFLPLSSLVVKFELLNEIGVEDVFFVIFSSRVDALDLNDSIDGLSSGLIGGSVDLVLCSTLADADHTVV